MNAEFRSNNRSSCPEMFYKKGALRSFAKFTGKHIWLSLSFDKLADCMLAALLKKDSSTGVFHVNFIKFLGIIFLQNK